MVVFTLASFQKFPLTSEKTTVSRVARPKFIAAKLSDLATPAAIFRVPLAVWRRLYCSGNTDCALHWGGALWAFMWLVAVFHRMDKILRMLALWTDVFVDWHFISLIF
jgi:hypothetical protein